MVPCHRARSPRPSYRALKRFTSSFPRTHSFISVLLLSTVAGQRSDTGAPLQLMGSGLGHFEHSASMKADQNGRYGRQHHLACINSLGLFRFVVHLPQIYYRPALVVSVVVTANASATASWSFIQVKLLRSIEFARLRCFMLVDTWLRRHGE